MPFTGFPSNTDQYPMPGPLFGVLLEEINSLEELKVIIRMIRMIQNKKGPIKSIRLTEILSDRILVNAIGEGSKIRKGLDSAVRRKVFLEVISNQGSRSFYLNSPANQEYINKNNLDKQDWELDNEPWETSKKRSEIYLLYEQNIGLLTPIITEKIKEADDDYHSHWIKEAIDVAVSQNKRNWSYISAILIRWQSEGKENGKSQGHSRKSRYI